VYAGQIIGRNIKPASCCKCNGTQKSNQPQSQWSDDASRIAPENINDGWKNVGYIQQDECIEVTPKNIRMRKVISE